MLIDKGILSSADLNLLTQVLKACKDIERIGDYGENLIDFYNNTYERKEELSNVARSIIDKCQNNAISLLKETLEVYKAESLDMGVKVIQERRELNADLDRDINSYFDLKSKDTAKKASYISLVFVDIMNSYQRVYSHCSNIAKLYGTDKVYEFDE